MRSIFLTLTLWVYALSHGFSQQVNVTKASEQKWSGGVVGRSGMNYYINLKVDKGNKVSFDSVYINNRGYAIIPAGREGSNLTLDTAKQVYTIAVGEVRWSRPNPVNPNQQEQEYKGPMRTFDGKALVVYTYKKKKHLLLIKEINALPPRMYP